MTKLSKDQVVQRLFVVASMAVFVPGCGTFQSPPSFEPLRETSAHAVPGADHRHHLRGRVTIGNVYVATSAYSTGTDQLLRFPAGENTSTPNKMVSLAGNPTALAVSPFNGRVAVNTTDGELHVFNKNLSPLYSFTAPHSSFGGAVSVAYDIDSNLWIGTLQDVGGMAGGYLYEYYGNDTTPDNTYYIPHGDPSTAQTPWSMAFDGEDSLYVEAQKYVWVACNMTSGCSNTKVPSYSYVGSGSEAIVQIALLNGTTPNPELVTYSVNQTYYYAPPASGVGGSWTLVETKKHCDGTPSMSINYLQSDPNSTLYFTCLVAGANASVVVELQGDGTKYTISNLTRPVAAAAY